MTATSRQTPLAEQVPPHDEAAERAALGSCFIDARAARIVFDELTADDFYLPRHKTLFAALKKIFETKGNLDEIFVEAELKRQSLLESIGGKGALGKIIMATPTAANCETYVQLVKDRVADRETLKLAGRLEQAAQLGNGAKILTELGFAAATPLTDILRPNDLAAFDTSNDESCLLGRRWLCRGAGCLIIGQAGLGKSSFAMQAAITWALGQPLFGITPVRPLSSLIVQAENDKGDLAEQYQGAVAGLGLHTSELQGRLNFISERSLTGEKFTRALRSWLLQFKPDLCFIDPLLAYIGGDVSQQAVCSLFFRNLLNPIASETGTTFLVNHHTPKPPRDPALRNGYKGGDFTYLGAGSAELGNWPRAVITLREIEDDLYELRLPKRGTRAGMTATDEPGAPLTAVAYLRHGTAGICWQRADRVPNQTELEVQTVQAEEILSKISTPMRYGEILAITEKVLRCKRTKAGDFFTACLNQHLNHAAGFYTVKNQTVRNRPFSSAPDESVRVRAPLKGADDGRGRPAGEGVRTDTRTAKGGINEPT